MGYFVINLRLVEKQVDSYALLWNTFPLSKGQIEVQKSSFDLLTLYLEILKVSLAAPRVIE